MEQTKVVIFDIDGTLLDSEQDITDAMNKMLLSRGYPTVTNKEMQSFLGGSAEDIVRLSLKKKVEKKELQECLDGYTRYYIGGKSPKTKPYEGIKETLAELRARGYRLAVMSNKPQEEIETIKDRLLVPLGIEKFVGLSREVPSKPNPHGAKLIMNEFGAKPENTFFVGDGETDVMTAINGGVKCVAVLWGNRSREYLAKFGATVFAEKPSDLLDVID